VIFEPGKKHLFLDISSTNNDTFVPSPYQFFETPQHEGPLIDVSATSAPPSHHLRFSNVIQRISRPSCEQLYATNTSHRKQETFHNEYPLQWALLPRKKTHNRTHIFGSTLLKHGLHFDYWNKPLNICMCVCYLDCHEAGLCCYLVLHIQNLLRPLQLFYFHLRPIYWLSVVALNAIILDNLVM
jgi:hypothetical protein